MSNDKQPKRKKRSTSKTRKKSGARLPTNAAVNGPKAEKRQTVIPGTEPPSFPQIDHKVVEWRDVVDRRSKLTDQEKVAKEAVFRAMRGLRHLLPTDKEGDPVYRYVDGDSVYVFGLKDHLVFKKARVVQPPLEGE